MGNVFEFCLRHFFSPVGCPGLLIPVVQEVGGLDGFGPLPDIRDLAGRERMAGRVVSCYVVPHADGAGVVACGCISATAARECVADDDDCSLGVHFFAPFWFGGSLTRWFIPT